MKCHTIFKTITANASYMIAKLYKKCIESDIQRQIQMQTQKETNRKVQTDKQTRPTYKQPHTQIDNRHRHTDTQTQTQTQTPTHTDTGRQVVSFASENMYTLTYEHYKAFSFSRVVSAVMYDSVIVRNK